MPYYDYYCSDCKDRFYVMHSMSEKWDKCEYCGGTNIERMMADIAYDIKPNNYKNKVGDIVKSHIEDARKDINEYKKEMKKGL